MIHYAYSKHKKAEVAIQLSGKIDFKWKKKTFPRKNEEHFIKIKGTIPQ